MGEWLAARRCWRASGVDLQQRPDVRLMSVGQGQLCAEVGLTKLVPTGTDLT
jgi:hypothetical protein